MYRLGGLGRSSCGGKQLPGFAVGFERVRSAIEEGDAGAGDEIGHGAADEHFACRRALADRTGTLVGAPRDMPPGCQLALAGVQAEMSGPAETRTVADEGAGTGNGSGRTVECGYETVAREHHTASPEPRDLPAGMGIEVSLGGVP